MSLKVLSVLAFFIIYAESRGDIKMGSVHDAHKIYHETHEKYGIPFMHRHEDVVIEGKGKERISAVLVHDLKGDGFSYVKSGGIGLKNVTIRLESGTRGHGYKFLVEAYAL